MEKSYSESYKEAGVDITAGYRAVELMKEHISKTMQFGGSEEIGGFGGLFKLDLSEIKEPVLVSGTDGVGTKLKIAFLLNKHDTVGQDCVAMCVNDVLCVGAQPLFFLDYIAVGKNIPEKIAEIVKGVALGCMEARSALIGGETAEMPGFYGEDEYDLAGFSVGIVDKSKIIDKEKMAEGDIIIGLPSSGIHSNGYSLVRKVFDVENINLKEPVAELGGKTLGETLLEPTKIYVKPVTALLKEIAPKGIAHITGGGFYENIPRCLKDNMKAVIEEEKLDILPIFKLIEKKGNISRRDMYNTFNMGTGMVVVVSPDDVDRSLEILRENGENPRVIGIIKEGEKGVEIC